MAVELIELYAQRKSKPGYAFPPDTPLQRALEDSFLFSFTDMPVQQKLGVFREAA